ncbi:uncharacterized protein METZ01_LOCUS458737, partial [marine metagenome]
VRLGGASLSAFSFGCSLFPHPTNNKPITIGISTFIAGRILPHPPDCYGQFSSTIQNG